MLSFSVLSFSADRKQLSAASAAVEANLKTPEGKKYENDHVGQDFQKYAPAVRQCKPAGSGTPTDFDLLLRLNPDGKVAEALVYPETVMAKCSGAALLNAQFTPPPHSDYWVNIHLQFKH
jgi:hypothetical protein